MLNLVVIRAPDIEKAAAFYSALGLTFAKHAHGQGPSHYTAEFDGMVFEIYPEKGTPTTGTRLGFKVPNMYSILDKLVAKGGIIHMHPKMTPEGHRAVVIDPAGHKVELTT